MTTKRELLLEICETPGWQPPQPVASSIERHLNALLQEGWIHPRLDGWEATHDALDAYPRFEAQNDIADPTAPLPGAREIAEPPARADVVTLDRVTTFILALIAELPLPTLYKCAAMPRAQLGVGAGRPLEQIARSIAEGMR